MTAAGTPGVAIPESVWDVLALNGLDIPNVLALSERLRNDYTVADWGFAQLYQPGNGYACAMVSDQLVQSCGAIADNLHEALLHSRDFAEILPAGGAGIDTTIPAAETIERTARATMSLTGCVRGLTSVLDCLAAVAAGVERIPASVTRADWRLLTTRSWTKKAQTPEQGQLWVDLGAAVDAISAEEPTGWMQWLDDMRNTHVHRHRFDKLFQMKGKDPDQPAAYIVCGDPKLSSQMMMKYHDFVLTLPRRPHLPEFQDMASLDDVRKLRLGEAAALTLHGVAMLVGDIANRLAEHLQGAWELQQNSPAKYPVTWDRWQPNTTEEARSFNGITDLDFAVGSGSEMHISPSAGDRWSLVTRVRALIGKQN